MLNEVLYTVEGLLFIIILMVMNMIFTRQVDYKLKLGRGIEFLLTVVLILGEYLFYLTIVRDYNPPYAIREIQVFYLFFIALAYIVIYAFVNAYWKSQRARSRPPSRKRRPPRKH